MNEAHLNRLRSRWAAVGAAVAITLGAGGIGIVNAQDGGPVDVAGEDVNLGDLPVFRPTNPCRLADTRASSPVGVRTTPLGEGQSQIHTVYGSNGFCNGVPDDVVAIVTNVTAVNPSADTFLSLAPGGTPSTGTSSLNVVARQAPTPNSVTVGLDDSGRFNIYNKWGSIDYIIDIVGIYRNHNHDLTYQRTSSVLFAAVSPAGVNPAIVRGRGALAVTRENSGYFNVTFDRDVSTCVWTATYGQATNAAVDAHWATTRGGASPNQVGVVIRNQAGTQVDGQGFHLLVTCP